MKGKPAEVISANHQDKPGVGIAHNWFDNEKVDAIFDVPTSSVALPISALTREKNKININSVGGSSDITERKRARHLPGALLLMTSSDTAFGAGGWPVRTRPSMAECRNTGAARFPLSDHPSRNPCRRGTTARA